MNQRRHTTVIAGIATILGSAPLAVLFVQWTWLIDCIIATIAVSGAALCARMLRAPAWAQPLAGALGLLFMLTWLNSSGGEYLGILPSPATFAHFQTLLTAAGSDIRSFGIPVQDTDGLLFITTIGVGICAIIIDFVAVTLRRPALAGLPMLAIYAVPVAIDTSSTNVFTFLVAASGYVWLLVSDNIDRVRLFGRRFTGDGRGVDMWEPSPLAAVGRRLAVIGMALAIILPVAAPGMTKGLLNAFGTGGAGGGPGSCQACLPGASVNMLATLSGQLQKNITFEMADVYTDDPNPQYLRLGVADQITNEGFLTRPGNGVSVGNGTTNPFLNPDTLVPNPGVTLNHHTAQVTIKNLSLAFMPTYPALSTGTLRVSASWRYDPDRMEVFSGDNTKTNIGMEYTFAFDHPDFDLEALKAAPNLDVDNPIQASYAKVPQKVAQVDAVLNNPDYQASNEYDRVIKLAHYFDPSNGFVYDVTTKPGSSGTDIGDFLTQKHGYCVQFAAALAWLIRAANYPARVAFGFTQGTAQATPGVYQFTNQNLHAWTEVYFAGIGWVPFDATPSVPGSLNWPWDLDLTPTTTASNPTLSSGPAVGSGGSGNSSGPAHLRTETEINGGATGGRASNDYGWYALGVLGLLVIALLSPVVARSLLRRRRAAADRLLDATSAAPGEPYVVVDGGTDAVTVRHRIHAAWDEFMDTLIDYRVPLDPAETPRTAAERIATTLYLPHQVAADVRMLGEAEERARYAPLPGPTPPLAGPLRSIRRALASRVSFGRRLQAAVLPPSVTQRWRESSLAWWAQTVARTQAVTDKTLRALSIRRWLGAPRRLLAGRGTR